MATWILTASPENHEATMAPDLGVIGFEERRRRQAREVEHGEDRPPAERWILLDRMRARAGAPVTR
jgi:hypothetical protein